MLWLYLLLTLVALGVTVALARRRSRQAVTAAVAAVLGVLASVTGFSIGPYVALVALAVLMVAAAGLRPRRREQPGT